MGCEDGIVPFPYHMATVARNSIYSYRYEMRGAVEIAAKLRQTGWYLQRLSPD